MLMYHFLLFQTNFRTFPCTWGQNSRTHRFRQIILQQFNALPNDERRERFREAVETLFVRFGGNMADLEEVE